MAFLSLSLPLFFAVKKNFYVPVYFVSGSSLTFYQISGSFSTTTTTTAGAGAKMQSLLPQPR